MSRATKICILAAMLALSVGCFAQSPKVIAQKLADQLDQAGANANANHDVNQAFGFHDSSYVLTDHQGKRYSLAELRKQVEQAFATYRHWNPSTTVEAVQLEGGRMVVYYKTEVRFEFHHQRAGWMPMTYKETGESTWEKKDGQWKLVLGKTFRADAQVDPA